MSPLIIEAHGKTYSGEYSVSRAILTVAFEGATKQEEIDDASLLVVARRLLRELVYDRERLSQRAAGDATPRASKDTRRP
jgi:hypothetical protein